MLYCVGAPQLLSIIHATGMIRQHSVYFCTDYLQTHMTIIISIIKTYMTSVEEDRALNSSLNGQTREPHEI